MGVGTQIFVQVVAALLILWLTKLFFEKGGSAAIQQVVQPATGKNVMPQRIELSRNIK